MIYILDTDFCIEILRGRPSVVQKVKSLPEDAVLTTTFVNAAELYYGAHLSHRPQENLAKTRAFTERVVVLYPNDLVLENYGRFKAQLQKEGQLIPDNDLFIGACALVYNGLLVTHNIKHFARLPIAVEDWLS